MKGKRLQPKPREPHTREEWQEAVDAAKALLTLEAARVYGLVRGGPAVDIERCLEILDRAAGLGIVPTLRAVEQFLDAWQRAHAEERRDKGAGEQRSMPDLDEVAAIQERERRAKEDMKTRLVLAVMFFVAERFYDLYRRRRWGWAIQVAAELAYRARWLTNT